MAEIFRGKNVGAEGFEREVVIKRILPHFTEDEAFVKMFIDEATLAAKLSHANVVQIFDFDRVDDTYYIAMEYVEGEDLRRVIGRGQELGQPIPLPVCLWILIEAAKGLHYAHTRKHKNVHLKIVHRDVSPHNIMVSYNGEVKIMDFGIAKAASRSTSTRAGTVKGKCAYMSPEQARGEELDGRSDLFSLTVVLWEILTQKRLFASENDFEALRKVNDCEIEKPSTYNSEISEELDAIIMKALSREKEDRHEHVGAFVEDLQRYFYTTVTDSAHASLIAYMRALFDDDIVTLENFKAQEATGYSDALVESLTMTALDEDSTSTVKDEAQELSSASTAVNDDNASGAFDRTLTDSSRVQTTQGPSEARTITDSAAHRATQAMDTPTPEKKKSRIGLFLFLAVLAVAAVLGGPILLDAISSGDQKNNTTSEEEGGEGIGDGEETATLIFTHSVPGATIAVNGVSLEGTVWKGPLGSPLQVQLIKDNISGPPLAVMADQPTRTVPLAWIENQDTISIQISAPDDVYLQIGGKEFGPGMVVYDGARLNDEIQVQAYRTGGQPFQRKLILARDGQTFVITADEVPTVQPAAVVTLKVKPADALLRINGEEVEVVDGVVTLTNYRLGDQLGILAQKKDYQPYEKRLPVNKTLMVVPIKLKKVNESSGFGKLSIDADPWADVYLNGKKLGTTPLRDIRVPAGSLRLKLKKDTTTKTIRVQVPRGGAISKRVQM